MKWGNDEWGDEVVAGEEWEIRMGTIERSLDTCDTSNDDAS